MAYSQISVSIDPIADEPEVFHSIYFHSTILLEIIGSMTIFRRFDDVSMRVNSYWIPNTMDKNLKGIFDYK